ncbi:hypothetical protein NOS3756_55170 [Nostoc sp. NIES-3756]|jgi:hypothetical protein|uniref:hypothetical protein n=1 Tax=Nostoc sp. NIES-3756 TaxID=1751286 RepID=UPI000720C3BE|nr:hypothetical protein [Nostoc sp. NIES-3756]BAT56510.1 hypothetical protein NOS3756_55170 [Nostoc sp. NIES-3756]BAY35735.1 hypothetical protein NIES2111_00510 [Nostoc sp. NIES-2111]
MNEKCICFQPLSAEESCVVSGGSTEPLFVPKSEREGTIFNANSNGESVKVSTNKKDTTDTTNSVDILALALPQMPKITG